MTLVFVQTVILLLKELENNREAIHAYLREKK